MPQYTTSDIRNILLAGHGGSGKTTLAEALLYAGGALKQKTSVADGTSISDHEKEEKEHKHSIFASMLHVNHQGRRINLIDTPGSPDLAGQAMQCVAAVETVIIVINAQAGIEVMARRMMELAAEQNLPRVIVINKIDQPDTNPDALVRRIQGAFGSECLPINLPAQGGKSVIGSLLNKEGTSDLGDVSAAHSALLDQIVEMDEELMEKYLGGDEPDYSALHAPFELALGRGHLIPICFTDAKSGVGVPELLDIIANYFPNPLEGNPRPFMTGTDAGETPFACQNDIARPLLAHVFKVSTDPFAGKQAAVRIHQGEMTPNSQVFIGHNKKPVKLGHLFHLQGRDHIEADRLIAGDIGAVVKIDDIHANDVLHSDHVLDDVHLKRIDYPIPMYGLAITPKARGDEQKLSAALTRIAEEDPTFRWGHDRQTHQVVINGLGELHLRLILQRMANRGLHVDTQPPKIAYRETITAQADGHHRHKKQTGGAGQFGEVFLRIEPLERGGGFEFVNEVFGGAIPGQFIPAVEKGVREMLEQGVLAGYPLQDIRVAVTDGKHHPVDSKEVAFKAAGRHAFRDAVLKAHPVLLEPIVNMEVTVPEDKMGAITGDLAGKRGRIQGTDILPGQIAQIRAQAPLAEVMQYQSQLKSVTGGQGSFTMRFSHYDPVPPQIQQRIAAEYKPREEEE